MVNQFGRLAASQPQSTAFPACRLRRQAGKAVISYEAVVLAYKTDSPSGLAGWGLKRASMRGIVLLLVLVVVTMLGLSTLGFCELMLNERRAAQTSVRQAQVRAFAQSGVEVVRQFLDRDPTAQNEAGGLFDNSQRFADQIVAPDDSPRDQGRFSVIAPQIDDQAVTGVRYGIQDESAKLNLALVPQMEKKAPGSAKAALMQLPGMTDDVADAILDWIDDDDTPREQGAEADYYSTLTPAYAPRNALPVTIEELLSVRGVTPEMLYGLDATRMGLTGADSPTDGSITGVDNSDGTMDHGWAAYLTLWSTETNLKPDGSKRINLNQRDLKGLYDSLTQALDASAAEFVVAYRAGGKAQANGAGHLDTSKLSQARASVKLTTMLDLFGARATLAPPPNNSRRGRTPPPITVRNPFTVDTAAMDNYIPKLMDNCTTTSKTAITGRININQAPRVVLMCIPGMTTDLADQIIAKRTQDPASASFPPDQKYGTWPLVEGITDLKTMKKLYPFVTAGGNVYRAQIIGTFDKGSPSARIEAVFDATQRPTRLLFWKDMTRSPGGFPVEPSVSTNGTGS